MTWVPLVLSVTLITISFVVNSSYWVGLLLGALGSFLLVKSDLKILIISTFILLVSLTPVIYNLIYYGSLAGVNHWVALLLSIFLAGGISKLKPLSTLASLIPFISITSLFLIQIFLGKAPDAWLPNNSENFISVSMIIAYLSYLLLSKRNKVTSLEIILSVIVVALSIYAKGRGGIISSCMVLIGSLLVYIHGIGFNRSWMRKILTYTFLVILISLPTIYAFLWIYELGALERLTSKGLESNARIYIYLEYISLLSSEVNAIFGVPSESISSIARFGYNLHSSYLNIHSKFGLVFSMLFVYMSIFVFYKSILSRDFIIFFPALLAIYLRASTDIQIFAGRADWILFSVFFYFLFYAKK